MLTIKRFIVLIALILGTWLVLPVSAQNYVWGSINGIPFGPGVIVSGPVRFGGTTSAFAMLKGSGTELQARLADDSGYAAFTASVVTGTVRYQLNAAGTSFIFGAAPTISSGFGTSPSIVANNGTAAFTINVGTGGTASSGVIGLSTAATGWRVACDDVTTKSATVFLTKQTATSTTTATVGNFDAAGAAAAWVASDVLVCNAMAY